MAVLKYKIIQISAKNLLFRKCGKCSNQIVFVVVNEQGMDCFYCEKCRELVQQFKINYKLNLVMFDICHNQIDTLQAYDEVVEKFIGCSATEFAEHLKQDPLLIRKLEQELVGMYCIAEVLNPKSNSKKTNEDMTKKCKSLVLQYPENIKLIDIIRNDHAQLEYDPSMMVL